MGFRQPKHRIGHDCDFEIMGRNAVSQKRTEKKKYNRNQQQQQNGRKSRIKATKAMTNGTEKQMTNGDGVFLHRCCSHHFS